MSTDISFWTDHYHLPEGCLLWKCGPLSLYVKRRYGDWLTTYTYAETEDVPFSAESSDFDATNWSRWTFSNSPDSFMVSPVMPNLPIVVRPRFPIILPPGVHADFFVSIPLHAQVVVGVNDYMYPVTPVPILNLSKTWFGNFREGEGELCYSLRTVAVRDESRSKISPYKAICPVKIKNQSAGPLHFDKICLRVQYLNIYQSTDGLWTNPVIIKSTRTDDLGDVKYERKSPRQAKSPKLITNALKIPPKGFVGRTFGLTNFDPF